MTKIKLNDDQTAYNLGYDNPAVAFRNTFTAPHMTVANAYFCGQADAQNQQPKASPYRMEDYDFPTCERKRPPVELPDGEG